MAATLDNAVDMNSSEQLQAEVPRKRRKRSSAAGAADDCFTCTSARIPCDRKRPYCSQCLSRGIDCAGYKTQLTWGVGVASRGKLRGLSLPITGVNQHAVFQATPSKPKKDSVSVSSQASLTDTSHKRSNTPFVQLSEQPFEFDLTSPVSTSISHIRHMSPSSGHVANSRSTLPNVAVTRPVLKHNKTSPSYLRIDQLSPYVDRQDLHLSEGHTPTSSTGPSTSSPGKSASSRGFLETPTNSFQIFPRNKTPPDYPTFDTALSDYQTQFNPIPVNPYSGLEDVDWFASEENEDDLRFQGPFTAPNPETQSSDITVQSSPVYPARPVSFLSYKSVGQSPRMQYLIRYYTEVISPVIVAFDGPTNPYRNHIIGLASKSETLQHAICALAACNLRQRQESGKLSSSRSDSARRSSIAHLTLTSIPAQRFSSLQELAKEQVFHKQRAVQLLNKALGNAVLRKDDTTLATLLMLCLFHICDSGIAKFQAQFAGVKKLLDLRGNDPASVTTESKWLARMFMWFDAMTASVNSREGLFGEAYLDVSTQFDAEWTLENLTGCDGVLFSSIAKLGRLNVLAQGKPVQDAHFQGSQSSATIDFNQPEYRIFDGDDWMRVIADSNFFDAKTPNDPPQTQFWREWRQIRHDLQCWQLDTAKFEGSGSKVPYLTPDQKLDLLHISNSFRYSALLYTERLAHPYAASTDPNIQSCVSQALQSIKQVRSDVYLLWPLFITGSECITLRDRNVIRQRCLDIQMDSGFLNNKSCLDLLEKVWLANPAVDSTQPFVQFPQWHTPITGLRFDEIMRAENHEGEYIVV